MKFIDFLNEYNGKDDDDSDLSDSELALKKYVLDPSISNKSKVVRNFDDLLYDYGNDKDLIVYRGLNFKDKEEYEDFINHVGKTKKFKVQDKWISSWTRKKSTAEQFAVSRPSYMEAMSIENMALINKAKEENQHVVGYRGLIVKTTIKKGQAIDVNKSPFSAEDELLLVPGKYDIEIEEFLTNSDTIKKEGLSQALAKYSDSNTIDDRKVSIIMKIINDHADELANKDKSILGKYFLKNTEMLVDLHENPVSGARHISVSCSDYKFVEKYKHIFLERDYDRYFNAFYKGVRKGIKQIAKHVKEDIDTKIIWNGINVKELVDLADAEEEFYDLKQIYGNKYRELNSSQNINRINKLPPAEKKKELEALNKMISDILASIG